jgi:hypothetical protein
LVSVAVFPLKTIHHHQQAARVAAEEAVTRLPTEQRPRAALIARGTRIFAALRARQGSQIQIQIAQEAARFAADEAVHKARNEIPRCLTAAVDALDDVSRESEDHGAPDAYCASTDGTVQQGTAQLDMPSPRSSTPPSDKSGYSCEMDPCIESSCELDACSDDEHDGFCNGSSVLDTSEDSESGGPRASLQKQLGSLRKAFRTQNHSNNMDVVDYARQMYGMRLEITALHKKYDMLCQAAGLQVSPRQEQSPQHVWHIPAPADDPWIASQLDLGPATGAAPLGTPNNKTTAPVSALETTSELGTTVTAMAPSGTPTNNKTTAPVSALECKEQSLLKSELGTTDTAMARHQKPTQGRNFTRDQPPSSGRSSDTGMAAGAPADGFVKQLPALSTKTPTTEPPLAAAADHGEYNTQPNPGSSPATPAPPSAAGAAHATPATKPKQPAQYQKSKQSKKSKENENAKKKRGARRPPGHAEEEPTMQMMGLLADAELEDDAAALDADSGGCTDADMASDGEGL